MALDYGDRLRIGEAVREVLEDAMPDDVHAWCAKCEETCDSPFDEAGIELPRPAHLAEKVIAELERYGFEVRRT